MSGTSDTASGNPVPAASPDQTRRWFWTVLFGAAIVALLAALLGLNIGGLRNRLFSRDSYQIRSLAVLPLENLSGDPRQEYFADGMTEALIAELSRIRALRVISRTSVMQFKGDGRLPTPEIAKRLDVDAVVEGSVVRAGDRVRITAQLIDARADRHLWAQSFERQSKDVLTLQGERHR